MTWGLRVKDSYALVDSDLSINNNKVGKVTSSTWSPYQVCGVSIVHMKNNSFGPGTLVDVLCEDGKIHTGAIVNLRMYVTLRKI